MQIKDCKTGTEVVLRAKIAGISADGSSVRIETKEGSAMYYRPELLELVKPAEEIEAKTSTPEEACCNIAEQAPVTVEMIEEAYNRLEELVIQCKTPVLMTMIFRKDGKTNQRISTNDSVSGMAGSEGIKWTAARGFLYAAGACISGAPKAVLQGIEYTFEFLERKEKRGLFAGITDTPFEH